MSHFGEIAALCTAFFWTITALSFEYASKRVGSIAVNFIRLCIGFLFLTTFSWIYRGIALPIDASGGAWLWLSLSGLVGFVFGDLFLFKSYTIIGSRVSMLIMTLVPPFTAIAGWIALHEAITLQELLGMIVTIAGIIMVLLTKKNDEGKLKFNHPIKGILYAVAGALGQALGLVLSKYGLKNYDAFAGTQIRIITGIVGFVIIVSIFRRWSKIISVRKDFKAVKTISLGSFFGPFLGVSFSLLAVQHANVGIASTIMAIIPVLIIPPAIFIFHQKVTIKEIVGAFISIAGVAIFFI